MPNTLGLDDDLDGNDLVDLVEKSFGIRFTNAEWETFRTVGDIFEVIRRHFSSRQDGADRCATAMAFYRLRSALSDLNPNIKLEPGTRLEEVSTLSARAVFKTLRMRTGLRLPPRRLTSLGDFGMWCLVAGPIGLIATFGLDRQLWPVPALAIAIGVPLLMVDPGKFPAELQTLGDLSRTVAGLNFGQLAAAGAEPRDKDLWNALTEVLSQYSILPKSEMQPGTFLLQSQMCSE